MDKAVLIERPAREIFNYVLDCHNSSHYLGKNFNFQATTPPPYRVGTKAAAVGQFGGYMVRLSYTIIELQPDRLIRLRALNQHLNGVVVDSEVCWCFEERASGRTVVRFQLNIQPRPNSFKGLKMFLVTPVIAAVESGISYMLDGSLLKLKRTLEHRSQLAGSAVGS